MNSFALISSLFLLFSVSPILSSPLDLITGSLAGNVEGSPQNEGVFVGFLQPGQNIVTFIKSIPFLSEARDFIRSGAETTWGEINNLRASVSSTAAANPISTIFENTIHSLHAGAQNIGQLMTNIVQEEEAPPAFRGNRIASQVRNGTQKNDQSSRPHMELSEVYKRFLQQSQNDTAPLRVTPFKITKTASNQTETSAHLSNEDADQEESFSSQINKLTPNNRTLKKDLTKLKNLKYKYPSRIAPYVSLKSKKGFKIPNGLKKRKYISAVTSTVPESSSKENVPWSDSSKNAFVQPSSFAPTQSIPKPFVPPEMKSTHYFEDASSPKFDFYQNVFAN